MTLKALMDDATHESGWKSLQPLRKLIAGNPTRTERIAVANFLTGNALTEREDFARRQVRVAVASDASLENLKEPLALQLLERGLFCQFHHSPFGQIAQEVRNPTSELSTHQPDVVVLAPLTNFWSRIGESNSVDYRQIVDEAWSHVTELRSRFSGPILVVNTVQVESRPHGILENRRPASRSDLVRSINLLLSERCRETGLAFVVDADFHAARCGAGWTSHHKQFWLASRPLSDELAARVAGDVSAFCAALKGFARKCLALDLDNTLWGGVVGEEGWSGVKLGGGYPSNLFTQLQIEIKQLHSRGVILALISKNNEADAWEVFERRPEMVLKRSDISAHRINWNDKASNLREIAAELNLGLDAFAVMDDNPVERAWIEESLPEVAVCPAGDPLEMLRWLSTCTLFDTLSITNEDSLRAQSYAAAEERKKLASNTSNLEEYLATLQTQIEVGLMTEVQLARTAQLTQKTNQFNLTTRRYSESELKARSTDPNCRIFWCACRDRFVDEGLIGVGIAIIENDEWRLDSFLMSCRVLGRGVERAFLQSICDAAAESGAKSLVGEFIPTAKNSQTELFFNDCGFKNSEQSSSSTFWRLELPNSNRLTPTSIQVQTNFAERTRAAA